MTSVEACFLTGHGGNEVVQVRERPAPPRRPGEVRVRMMAGGLNRVDLYMRNSGAGITHSLPMILGLDGAGVIDDADDDSGLARGAPVVVYPLRACGRCEFCLRGEEVLCTSARYLGEQVDGTFARTICVPAGNVFPKPERLSFTEAASLGVAWLTAWRMVHTKARITPRDSVLVFGIGGSVSLAALQMIADMGARAIAVSRDPAKLERARAFGADATVLAGEEDIPARVLALTGGRGVDAVIENVGKAVWPAALKSLVRGGRIVTCGATSGDDPSADLRRLFIRQIQIFGSTLGDRSEFSDLLAFMARSELRPQFDSVYAMADIHAPLDRLESGRQFGKIGLDLADAPSAKGTALK